MKRIFLLFTFIACSSILSAAPLWVTDAGRRKVFPEAEYISALGTAFNEDQAKSKAALAVSEYINTQISSSTKTRYSESEKNGTVIEEKSLEEEVQLLSSSNVYALEYTEPFYDSDSTRYYCVSYIEKAAAWRLVKPKLQKLSSEIESLLQGTSEDRSGFWKTLCFGKVVNSEKEFYSLYDFAVLVNKSGAANYTQCAQKILNAKNSLIQNKETQTVLLKVQNDKNAKVYRALAEYFESAGFTVGARNGKYICNAQASVDVRDDRSAFVSYPGLSLEVTDAFGIQIASYNISGKKTVGFKKESTEEKAYKVLENECSKIEWIK